MHKHREAPETPETPESFGFQELVEYAITPVLPGKMKELEPIITAFLEAIVSAWGSGFDNGAEMVTESIQEGLKILKAGRNHK